MKITKQALKRIIKEETRRLISEIGPPEHEAFKLDFDAADRVDRAVPRHGRPSERENQSAGLVHHLDNAYNIVHAIAGELDEGEFPDVEDANEARKSYMESLYEAAEILDSLRSRLEDLE